MTLTYELDLDILPLDLDAKIQVRTSVRSAVRVVTDRRTDTRCQTFELLFMSQNGFSHIVPLFVLCNRLLLHPCY